MIYSTRVTRGAVKTHLFIRNTLKNYNSPQVKRSVSLVRSFAFGFIALRMATAPIPFATPVLAADGSLDSEPPSTQRITTAVIDAISITPTPEAAVEHPLVVKQLTLTQIQVGKSLDTVATEQKEKVEKERKEAAKKAAKRAVQNFTMPVIQYTGGSIIEKIRETATQMYGSSQQADAAIYICMRESGCNPNSINKSSGACGIWQSYGHGGRGCQDIEEQIAWGLNYMRKFGSPVAAKTFWDAHHWY